MYGKEVIRDEHSRVPWESLLIIVPVWVRSPKAGLAQTQEVDFQVNPEKQVGEREEGKNKYNQVDVCGYRGSTLLCPQGHRSEGQDAELLFIHSVSHWLNAAWGQGDSILSRSLTLGSFGVGKTLVLT